MPASANFRTALANLILNNIALANIGNTGGLQPSTVAGNLYIALHSADPNTGSTQDTNEIAYTGYARVAVTRTGSGFTVASGSFSNTSTVTFPADTLGAPTITHFSIGVGASGATDMLLSGPLTTPLTLAVGESPSFAVGQLAGTVN